MTLSEGTKVSFRNLQGIIDFVCDSYIILQMKPKQNRSPPRLLIPKEFSKEIEILNE
jgi:hypothetical protein